MVAGSKPNSIFSKTLKPPFPLKPPQFNHHPQKPGPPNESPNVGHFHQIHIAVHSAAMLGVAPAMRAPLKHHWCHYPTRTRRNGRILPTRRNLSTPCGCPVFEKKNLVNFVGGVGNRDGLGKKLNICRISICNVGAWMMAVGKVIQKGATNNHI